jgi:hypothetical protein
MSFLIKLKTRYQFVLIFIFNISTILYTLKKLINNSWGKDKGNHYRVGGFICDKKIGTLRVHESTNSNKSLPHPTQQSIDNFKKWMASKH